MEPKVEHQQPIELSNHILGFFQKNDGQDVLDGLLKMDVPDDDIIVAPAEEAAKIIDVAGDESGPIIWAERLLQRVIGGGPAEVLRDVQLQYNDDVFFICVHVQNEQQKDEVADLMRRHHGEKVKYVNTYYVEHITVEPQHDQMGNVSIEPQSQT